MSSFRENFVTYSLVGLFMLAIISFVVQLQVDNNSSQSLLDNEIINKTYRDLEGNLSQTSTDSQTQKEAFEAEIPERGFGTLLIFSIVSVVQSFTSGITGIYNIMIVLPASILGVPKAVISIFSSILIVTLIILAFRVYRAGE